MTAPTRSLHALAHDLDRQLAAAYADDAPAPAGGDPLRELFDQFGRDVAFVRIPEEDHNLSRSGKPSRRIARLQHLIGWFDRHFADAPTSPPPAA